MTRYKKEIKEKNIDNKSLTVINLSPKLCCDERLQIKKSIERKLFDVFCKYL